MSRRGSIQFPSANAHLVSQVTPLAKLARRKERCLKSSQRGLTDLSRNCKRQGRIQRVNYCLFYRTRELFLSKKTKLLVLLLTMQRLKKPSRIPTVPFHCRISPLFQLLKSQYLLTNNNSDLSITDSIYPMQVNLGSQSNQEAPLTSSL